MAESVAESLTKGTRVIVTGSLEQRSWETQEGEKRSVVDVRIDEIGPALRYATATVTKTTRRDGDWQGGGAYRRPRRRGWPRHSPQSCGPRRLRARRGPLLRGERKEMAQQPRRRRRNEDRNKRIRKKVCYFCKERVEYIDFKDVGTLRRYMSDRAKIRARRVTGNCPRHQREVAVAIKNAREMALLPYVGRP